MTKKETLSAVEALLSKHKVAVESGLYKELIEMFVNKKSGHKDEFPDKLDKNGNITHIYCSWHKTYEPVAEFNKKGESYHYECKVAEKEWHKYGKAIKDVKTTMADLTNDILDEKISIEAAKEQRRGLQKQIELLESNRLAKINFEEQ